MTSQQRNQIIDAAVRLFGDRRPSLDEVANEAEVPAVTIRRAYDGYEAILRDYYVRAVERRDAQLEDIPDEPELPLEDRLGARLYLLLDQLDGDPDFVKGTFSSKAAWWGSPFRERLDRDIQTLLDSADVPGVNQIALGWSPVRGVLLESLVQTLRVWTEDDSADRQRSTALIDRLLAFYAEVATGRGLERGIEVIRYAAGAGYIPFVGAWFEDNRA